MEGKQAKDQRKPKETKPKLLFGRQTKQSITKKDQTQLKRPITKGDQITPFWKANKQKTKENQRRPNQGFFLEGKQNDQLPKKTK